MAEQEKSNAGATVQSEGHREVALQASGMPQAEDMGAAADEGHRQESLRDTLSERHVNMIAFSGTIGIGIFLSSGSILHTAGPGGAILAYALTGTIIWSAIASLGEMTALMPVKGPITEFPSRYLDDSVGFAVGWMFAYVSAFAAQTTASSSLMQFNYDNVLKWTFGIDTSPAIWISLFLFYMISVNLLPVRWLGEFEYFCGCLKMAVLASLVLLMIIITEGGAGFSHGEKIGGKYWHNPWGFFSSEYSTTVRDETFRFTGSLGRCLSLWTAMTSSVFSYVGMDLVAVTAAETRGFGDSESIKIATRKISLRVIVFYLLSSIAVSLPVAYDDRHLLNSNHGLASASSSPYTIAIYNAGIRALPHILNAFLIFSSTATGISGLYGASRTLHALALSGRVLEGPIARSLKLTKFGVPMVAVLASGAFGLLAFMSIKSGSTKVLLNL
ncbi:MAG: hypothetical protein M1813_002063 [Trichoglossum hirsutum]|nr:MAG: hypothetical protein M1813_002063 [Trichoglossum hirsutum]